MNKKPAALASLLAMAPCVAKAADDLTVVEVRLDRPTLVTLGVQVLIADDDNRDAVVTVRVREAGSTRWRDAPPLWRVRPESVGIAVPEQFAGTVFDLQPDTEYEIELHLTDPDGLDDTQLIVGQTRPIPRAEPQNPSLVAVAPSELQAALSSAAPGDVITLAPGTYTGTFSMQASGTPDDPIVIRGEDSATVVLDGNDCTGCNILEVYGSWVHIEDLTLTNGERALRFQGEGTEGDVLRRVIISNVVHGVGSRPGQLDFYVCDNDIRGRLDWPWVFDADASSHWDDRGVDLNGEGHVICHNRIEGFGDPMLNLTEGTRAWDFYGNDLYDCFDGIELDRVAGNVRVFRNRWTNVDSAISMQPVNGGPAYVLRNELHNVVSEQLKLKATGGEPSGAIVYHNTFVSPNLALSLQTPIVVHDFSIINNLFVGPQTLAGNRTVDWTAGVDNDEFDHNGYYPDGEFWFGQVDGQNRLYGSFAEAMASGEVEPNGVLLSRPIFVDDVVGPADETAEAVPGDFELDASSAAVDAGRVLFGVNAGFEGDAPDLGAREIGCAAPSYGPRSAADEAYYARVDCALGDDGGSGGTDTSGTGDDGSGTSGADGGQDAGTGGSAGTTTDTNSAGADSDGGSSGGCNCATSPVTSRWSLLFLLFVGGMQRRGRKASEEV